MYLSFNPVISKYTEHPLGLQWKCHILCLKNTSTFTQHRVQHGKVKQIGTVGLCWTILLVTIYHFFIGHKWSTSVSTWLSFHTKHLNRNSSPISVAPLLLFKPTCVSYIKSQKEQKAVLYQTVYLSKGLIIECSLVLRFLYYVYTMTQFAWNDLFM